MSTSNSHSVDPLFTSFQDRDRTYLDRVFYATGVLLDAADFQDEQTYHRGRLARILEYLHGSGTVAGLRVTWQPFAEATADQPEQAEELKVAPGLAVDALGRLIELPTQGVCLRLADWYAQQSDDDLAQGFHTAVQSGDMATATDGVVADLYLCFVPCERGYTPALAAGPFDATDAVQPARLRDGYSVEMYIRNAPLSLPQSPWPALDASDVSDRRDQLHGALLDRWQAPASETLEAAPIAADETSIFLARVVMPATQATPAARPDRLPDATVQIDNTSRSFVYPPSAIARWLGLDARPARATSEEPDS